MADVKISQRVFFLGAWRTQVIDDKLMDKIARQVRQWPKLPTKLTLSSNGLELLILNKNGEVTRTDRLPLQNILDFVNNKFSSVCLLAIVKGRENHFTVFVFLFNKEKDAAQMVQAYKHVKRNLSGEGYNFDLKTPKGMNWTLKASPVKQRSDYKQATVIKQGGTLLNGDIRNGHHSNISPGEARIVVGDYTTYVDSNGQHVDDGISHESLVSTSSDMKEELYHISEEVRAIKLMLEEQSSPKSPDSPNRKETSPIEPQRFVWNEHGDYEIVSSPTQAVYFDSYAQPAYRRTTYVPQRRDFGPGFVMARNKRERGQTVRHVIHPTYGHGSVSKQVPQVVLGPEHIVYNRPLRQRTTVTRVHSGPVSPTASGVSSTTIRRSIEDVYRPRTNSRGRRPPMVLINPAHVEHIKVSRNSSIQPERPNLEDLHRENIVVTEVVTENVPVEIEARVKEVYNVAQVKVNKDEQEDEQNDQSQENDSKIVNISVAESSDRLLQLEEDIDDDEAGNDDKISNYVHHNDVIIVDEVMGEGDDRTVITTRELEEERIQEEEKEIIQTNIVTSHTEPITVDADHDDENGEPTVTAFDDVPKPTVETRVTKRVTIVEAEMPGDSDDDHDNNRDEDDVEEEEPYVMDEELFKAYTSDPEIVIVERDGQADVQDNAINDSENYIDYSVNDEAEVVVRSTDITQDFESVPDEAVLDQVKNLHISDLDDNVVNSEYQHHADDFQTSRETSHTTYIMETVVNGEEYKESDVKEIEREVLDTDVYRSEDSVLF